MFVDVCECFLPDIFSIYLATNVCIFQMSNYHSIAYKVFDSVDESKFVSRNLASSVAYFDQKFVMNCEIIVVCKCNLYISVFSS